MKPLDVVPDALLALALGLMIFPHHALRTRNAASSSAYGEALTRLSHTHPGCETPLRACPMETDAVELNEV